MAALLGCALGNASISRGSCAALVRFAELGSSASLVEFADRKLCGREIGTPCGRDIFADYKAEGGAYSSGKKGTSVRASGKLHKHGSLWNIRQVDEDARSAQFRPAELESDRKLLTRWVSGTDLQKEMAGVVELEVYWCFVSSVGAAWSGG